MFHAHDLAVPNAKGLLTAVANGASTTRFTAYDALGRVTGSRQETDGQTYDFSYAYNRLGGLLTQTYPSGRQVTLSYDDAGRIDGATGAFSGSPATYASSFVYAAHGDILNMTLGNGPAESPEFNSLLQPTQVQAGSSALVGEANPAISLKTMRSAVRRLRLTRPLPYRRTAVVAR